LECKREQLQISPVTTGGHQGVCKMEEMPHRHASCTVYTMPDWAVGSEDYRTL